MKNAHFLRRGSAHRQAGFSLVELMVAITIGLILLAGLVTLYLNISSSNRELARSNQLIENGRAAVQVLQEDLLHAGYWGELDFSRDPAPTYASATALPDPCLASSNWTTAGQPGSTYTDNLIAIPLQGYANGADLTQCNVKDVSPQSDVLLVRHANTCVRGDAACADGADTGPHLQVSTCFDPLSAQPLYTVKTAGSNPSTADFPLRGKKCPPLPIASLQAPLRKVVSNIYYVAQVGGQPTLMRIALQNGTYTAPQALIPGIEHFRVEYGIDDRGRNGQPISATNPGDGAADRFITTTDLDAASKTGCAAGSRCFLMANTVAARIHVLARNLEPTPGHTDSRSYQLGQTAVAAANDGFKRHVFSTTVRLVNPSSRREQP